ncbi:MAG TPA: PD-(D/E)XK nuclease family protein [Symbiobacteriaceae bacterium]
MQAPEERYLSAMAIRTYLTCPLRFRYRYLDNLYWSRLWGGAPDERRALEQGQHFHLLARRYYAGVDPALIAAPVEGDVLTDWFHRLTQFLPRTFDRVFYPELELRLTRPDLRLVAKFDLVVVDPDGHATIFDWKTEKRMPRRSFLRKSPQTLVYRFLLCAAGGAYSPRGRFRPEEVSMVYWNPQFPDQWYRLPYSEAQYRKDEEYLCSLVSQILRTPRERFLATAEENVCRSCEYRMLCHGQRTDRAEAEEEEELAEETLSWDDLPELP